MLGQSEAQLAEITAQMENTEASDQELLKQLIGLAARVERATSMHMPSLLGHRGLLQLGGATHHPVARNTHSRHADHWRIPCNAVSLRP